MLYCTQCQRLLTIEELTHQLGGLCFDCWFAQRRTSESSARRIVTNEGMADYWRSDEAMENN